MTDLEAEATRLYGLPVEEFTAARDARVKELRSDKALAKSVKALRKPTVAAWTVNHLVREREDLVRQVLAIGDSLREAQAGAAGDALRELSKQRRQVVAAVVTTARELARDEGVRLTDAVVDQVTATLQAALSDPDAADEVLAGCLSQPLSSTGVVSLGLAASPPPAEPAAPVTELRPRQVDPKERKKAERRVQQAEAVLAQAEKGHEEAQEQHRSAQAEHLHLESRLDELRRQVAELETEAEQSATRLEELEAEVEETAELVEEAQQQVDEERERLAGLD
jgi:DNA repair exonuclease SbcCD ATPase subunit